MAIQRIGIIGCGKISGIYLKNLTGMFGKRVKVTAVTDPVYERAAKASSEFNVRHIEKMPDLASDPCGVAPRMEIARWAQRCS